MEGPNVQTQYLRSLNMARNLTVLDTFKMGYIYISTRVIHCRGKRIAGKYMQNIQKERNKFRHRIFLMSDVNQ